MSDPLFWTCDDDAEELHHTEMDEAIEAHLDAFWPASYEFKGNEKLRIEAFVAGLPAKVKVYGYERMELQDCHKINPTDLVGELMQQLEENNEELADAFGDTEWSDRIKPGGLAAIEEAAKALVDAIHANYVPWSCTQTTTVEIEPLAWIKEHRPDWLEVALSVEGGR